MGVLPQKIRLVRRNVFPGLKLYFMTTKIAELHCANYWSVGPVRPAMCFDQACCAMRMATGMLRIINLMYSYHQM